MKVFYITLHETIVNVAEVEIMAEDEPTARRNAMQSTRAVWDEQFRNTTVERVQLVTDSDDWQ